MIQQGGLDARTAEDKLQGTFSSDKNEILWKYGVNYNNEPEMFRKGSVVFREYELQEPRDANGNENGSVEQSPTAEASTDIPEQDAVLSKTQLEKMRRARAKARVVIEHIDIIKEEFWEKRPWILGGKPGKPVVREKP